jgi:DNA (cytosine-5)-methyltransferase 1
MADPSQLQRNGGDDHARISARPEAESEFGNSGGPDAVADPGSVGQQGSGKLVNSGSPQAHGERQADWAVDDGFGKVWAPEPGVGRVADGIPRRVDRLRALGNAVVPQVAEYVGHQLARMMGVRNA